jgi:hypothetical protein
MCVSNSRLTVFFEDPFWVGIYERESSGRFEAAKIIFGAEPKAGEIYAYLCQHWYDLNFSPAINEQIKRICFRNPKKRQREAAKAVENTGAGTKAQQALKLQQEQGKVERKARSKAVREAETARRFALLRKKRKARHRGH